MAKASVKSTSVDKYDNLTIVELENIIDALQNKQKLTPSPSLSQELSAARIALQQRQRTIKARVMEFEQTNDHHLVFFRSTKGFVKLAGHSALFFATTIADRIHWRYSLKLDTDHYSVSEDGIISFRSLTNISARLGEISIFPDPKLSDDELQFFALTKAYSHEQIAKLRDNSKQDIKRIMGIVLPASPIPSLYDAIMQTSQMIYYQFKHLSDTFARETLGRPMVQLTYGMSANYLRYARLKNQSDYRLLLEIIDSSRELRFYVAYASKLQILHHRDVCKVLEHLVAVERIAAKAYLRESERAANSQPTAKKTAEK